jgi:anti-anti-sigma factor
MTDQPALWLTVRQVDDQTVIAVGGELDLATVDEFAAGVRNELVAAAVHLDLSELAFLDSSGVRGLDDLVADVDREGWVLEISPVLRGAVRQVLELTGMLDLLPIADAPVSDGATG